ncbi:hypothetical protein [Amycolatopsis saalfeldensis]|uniref:hypothetical protein n=1 Tax=Amycolatopsis saalfeldensis TaxID=394193 RepID=UPI0015A5BDEA|nr:hypothetical protein [Amycolatopsis saalfeldensis]
MDDRVRGCPENLLPRSTPDAVERSRYRQDQGLSGFRLFTTGTTMPGQPPWRTSPR